MLPVFGIYTSFRNFLIFLGLRDFRVFIVLQMPSFAFECVPLHSSASSTYQLLRPRQQSRGGQLSKWSRATARSPFTEMRTRFALRYATNYSRNGIQRKSSWWMDFNTTLGFNQTLL